MMHRGEPRKSLNGMGFVAVQRRTTMHQEILVPRWALIALYSVVLYSVAMAVAGIGG